jgi:hypothetical protein
MIPQNMYMERWHLGEEDSSNDKGAGFGGIV